MATGEREEMNFYCYEGENEEGRVSCYPVNWRVLRHNKVSDRGYAMTMCGGEVSYMLNLEDCDKEQCVLRYKGADGAVREDKKKCVPAGAFMLAMGRNVESLDKLDEEHPKLARGFEMVGKADVIFSILLLPWIVRAFVISMGWNWDFFSEEYAKFAVLAMALYATDVNTREDECMSWCVSDDGANYNECLFSVCDFPI